MNGETVIGQVVVMFLVLMATPFLALAQTTSYWNNTTGNWNDSTKWGGGTPYANLADVGIATGGTVKAVASPADFAGELRICTNASLDPVIGVTSSCTNLHLVGGKIIGGTATIRGCMTVDTDSFLASTAGTALTLTNTISGTGGLNVAGTSPLYSIYGTNTGYSGNWTVSASSVQFHNKDAVGSGRVDIYGGNVKLPADIVTNRINIWTNGTLTLKDLANAAFPNLQDVHLQGGRINSAISSGVGLSGTITVDSLSYISFGGSVNVGSSLYATLLGSNDLIFQGAASYCQIQGTNTGWSGSWIVNTSELRIMTNTAIGAGSHLEVATNAIFSLYIDTKTNTLDKDVLCSGTLKSGIGNSSSAGNNTTLLFNGSNVRCGTNGGAGICTIRHDDPGAKGWLLAVVFTNNGAKYASVTCPVTGTGGVAGVDYGQLNVKGQTTLTNVDLNVAFGPGLGSLVGQTLVLVTNVASATTSSGTFRTVTFSGGLGGTVAYPPNAVTLLIRSRGTVAFFR
jgi:hypothetical protein